MERYLNYDSAGFIVGMNRVKDSIDNVHDDTQSIIALMSAQAQIGQTQLAEINKRLSEANHHHRAARRRQTRANRIIADGAIDTPASAGPSERRTRRSPVARINNHPYDTQQAQSRNTDTKARRARIVSSQDLNPESDERSGSSARRDSQGRFVSEGGGSASSESERRLNAIARNIANDMRLGVDGGGVDPMVDSMRELGTAMSPLGRAGKLALRGAKFSMSKFRAIKRREPLPQDQDRHNHENEKLLDKIWKAIRKSEGSGGGLLGGWLGGGGRNRGGRAGRGGGRIGKLKNLAGRGLRAVGGMKGLGWLAGAAGVAGLTMDWDSLNHKEKSAGVGSLVGGGGGAIAGATAGAMIGSIVPVVGTAVGGAVGMVVGGWLGSEGGEALGAAASPYIDSWTSSLVAYNLPKKMGDMWKDGINPFFSKMLDAASELYRSVTSGVSGAIDNVGNFLDGGLDGVTSANAGANGASPAQLSKTQLNRQKMVYDSFRNAGLSDAQARAMTAEVGRENGYQDRYLFGGHSDPANNEYNLGMFSWQKDRGKKLYKHLNSKGLIKNGKIMQSQEALNEQARFAVNEIQTNKTYSRTKREFLYDPNVSYGKANEVLGNNYIRWRYTDPKYRKHHTYRDQYKAAIDKQLRPIEDTTIIDEAKSKAGELIDTAKNKAGEVVDSVKETINPKTDSSVSKQKTRSAVSSNKQASNRLLAFSSPSTDTMSNSATQNDRGRRIKIVASTLKSSAITPTLNNGYLSTRLPVTRPPTIPPMPTITQRVDSGNAQKPIIVQTSNDTISQNVSDRGIAHAVTGGLGQDRHWG